LKDHKLQKIIKEELNKNLVNESNASKKLLFHVEHKLSIDKNIFRPGSEAFISLFNEVRQLSKKGNYSLNENEQFYIEQTDLGEYGYYEGSKVPLDYPMISDDDNLKEAEYNGRKVELDTPKRGGKGTRKYHVYVKNDKGNVIRVDFGLKGMRVRLSDEGARKSFAARHKCKEKDDKTKPGYWSCRLGRYPHLTGSKQKYTWW
jgi:hypothetical protein